MKLGRQLVSFPASPVESADRFVSEDHRLHAASYLPPLPTKWTRAQAFAGAP